MSSRRNPQIFQSCALYPVNTQIRSCMTNIVDSLAAPSATAAKNIPIAAARVVRTALAKPAETILCPSGRYAANLLIAKRAFVTRTPYCPIKFATGRSQKEFVNSLLKLAPNRTTVVRGVVIKTSVSVLQSTLQVTASLVILSIANAPQIIVTLRQTDAANLNRYGFYLTGLKLVVSCAS